jgi:hypothetical protein
MKGWNEIKEKPEIETPQLETTTQAALPPATTVAGVTKNTTRSFEPIIRKTVHDVRRRNS